MNFFEHQQRAKRNTLFLLLTYGTAVILLICAVYAAVVVIWLGGMQQLSTPPPSYRQEIPAVALWNPELFAAVAGVICVIVGLGSIYKVMQLAAGGGVAVAQQVGGRLLPPDSRDPLERKVLNVVEEMSIASGIPMPPVYLLDNENGINAFAAGFTTSRAIVAVSKGALLYLNRDELQGVIAHEFSHIFNGDMALNIRLMGVLHGISVVAFSGYLLMRLSTNGTVRYRRNETNRLQLALLFTGVVLMILGYIGVFFSGLIRMAISRQREFLADASAVQFTRNPLGISGALQKIGGLTQGSRINNPNASEVSHLFFADGLKRGFITLFTTHPPLDERIRRVDRSFSGEYPETRQVDLTAPEAKSSPKSRQRIQPFPWMQPAVLIDSIGAFSEKHVEYAHNLVSDLPPVLLAAARDPYSASLLIYLLLLDRAPNTRSNQLAWLDTALDQNRLADLKKLLPAEAAIAATTRLPLVELCFPALQQLASRQYAEFRSIVRGLIEADQTVSIFEYVIQVLLLYRLDQIHGLSPFRPKQKPTLADLLPAASTLLAAIAFFGNDDRKRAITAYTAGADNCGIAPELRPDFSKAFSVDLKALDQALATISFSTPSIKRKIIEACSAAVIADAQTTLTEGEILRAIASYLDCPIPPLIQTK